MDKISLLCKGTMEPWQVEYFGLKIELSLGVPVIFDNQKLKKRVERWDGLIETVHLPFRLEEHRTNRINIGALDDSWRQRSLEILTKGINIAGEIGASKVIMHSGFYRWEGEVAGEYARLIDGIKELAKVVNKNGLKLCVENNTFSFRGCPQDVTPEDIDKYREKMTFADYEDDWAEIVKDVGDPNVRLCLDTSHSVTSAQRVSSLDKRVEIMHKFLDPGELINHVHWSGNHLVDIRGRKDSHLPVNEGSIPLEISKRIRSLDATLLLERKINPEMFLKELEFIHTL